MEKDQLFFFKTIFNSIYIIKKKIFLISFLIILSFISSYFIHNNYNTENSFKSIYTVSWSDYDVIPFFESTKVKKRDLIKFEFKNYSSKFFKSEKANILNIDRIEFYYNNLSDFKILEKELDKFFLDFELFLLNLEVYSNNEKILLLKEASNPEGEINIKNLASQLENYNKNIIKMTKQILDQISLNTSNKDLNDLNEELRYEIQQKIYEQEVKAIELNYEIKRIIDSDTPTKDIIELEYANKIYSQKIQSLKKSGITSFYLNEISNKQLSKRDNLLWFKLIILKLFLIIILVLVFNSIYENYKKYSNTNT